MISFDTDICTNFEAASSREWLETDGIGGFASSTISGAHTRRYHTLLTAATKPPLGRVSMLSKFEEIVTIDGKSFALSANQYPNAVFPDGFKYLKDFRLNPFPVWTFEIEGVRIEKRIFMVYGENTTVVEFKAENSIAEISLELKPLLSFRDYHSLQHSNSEFNSQYDSTENFVTVKPYEEMPPLNFAHNALSINNSGVWYRNFQYAIERERGFDYLEDLFQPFIMNFNLSAESAVVIASTEIRKFSDITNLEKSEIARRENLIETAGAKNDFVKELVLAADQFIVSRGAGKTVIAGYPWFSDWGRDTMIALNGLTLAANRTEIAKSILYEFSLHISEGMIPNRFPDAGDEAEYNTVDATLWYFEAVRAYTEKTNDYAFVRENLYEKFVNIVLWHVCGTRYNIKVDAADGLLYAGDKTVQLTWMDAKIGDFVVTPRTGKAVEIQALWYNALCVMAGFAEKFGDEKDRRIYEEMAAETKESFNREFWNEQEECLFDVVDGDEKDASVRPNQIFAVSLPNTMLSIGRAQKIVAKVEADLLTPIGLRSLSPKDKNYCPVYIGTPFERDSAYHQGTVWAWLIGAFIDAYRRVCPNGQKTDARVNEILDGFRLQLNEAGVGQISEIFDASEPFKPRGCPAQAWSVAEVLRVLSK